LFANKRKQMRQESFRQGIWVALLLASPLLIAGSQCLLHRSPALLSQIKKARQQDLFVRIFARDLYRERNALRQLDQFRQAEGMTAEMGAETEFKGNRNLRQMLLRFTNKVK
jgi:hypothetical protein